KGAGAVIITAGVAQKPGETRLQLVERNASILRQIIPEVITHAPEAVLIITTNPVDVMTHLAAKIASGLGVPANRVMGSGTTLDTARFRALLGTHLRVDPQHVHGYVIGEHGDSEVLTWSIVDIGGSPLEDFAHMRGVTLDDATRGEIDHEVRHAAYAIIEGKGATYYGIGAALARIVDAIAHDHRAILTICSPMPEVAGVRDVTVSLPHLVGGSGVMEALPLKLSARETSALRISAQTIRAVIDEMEQSYAE
ncbi:MAG: L-lactate dehydrogenase, partial [Anaerolineae bacterium]|nr:L-lactate dehydrogenase [Anaerolineae bacterium]